MEPLMSSQLCPGGLAQGEKLFTKISQPILKTVKMRLLGNFLVANTPNVLIRFIYTACTRKKPRKELPGDPPAQRRQQVSQTVGCDFTEVRQNMSFALKLVSFTFYLPNATRYHIKSSRRACLSPFDRTMPWDGGWMAAAPAHGHGSGSTNSGVSSSANHSIGSY